MPTTKAKLEFVHAMARSTRATVRQCEALMRYAGTLRAHHEKANDGGVSLQEIAKFNRVVRKVTELCGEIDTGDAWRNGLREHWHKHECHPVFTNGATLRIRIPEGREIEVPA